MSTLTMGSLFDGIGGFPLAAERHGITPVWASEIERFPIEVTSEQFPSMAHQGDITKLKGKELFPVDIICGGSPCQDLSVAGARAGLAGARSGLFMEQVRIVKEMRAAEMERGRTGKEVRPRFVIWENVPGAFSSGTPKGEDFRIVLEEIVRVCFPGVTIPRPRCGSWLSAGAIIYDGVFSLAWRCLDAQYWGVAQRRKRIFLVVDFASMAAPMSLFDMLGQDDVRNAAPAKSVQHFANWSEEERLKYAPFMLLDLTPGHGDLFGEPYWDIRSAWRENGLSLNTGVAPRVPIRASLSSILESHPDKKYYLSPTACLGILRRAEERGKELPEQLKLALMAQAGLIPAWAASGALKAYHINQRDEGIDLGGVSGALMATTNMQMQTFITGEPSVLCLNDQGGAMMSVTEDMAGTLRAQEHGHQPLVYENHGIDARYTGPHRVVPTLSARAGTGGNNLPLVTGKAVPALIRRLTPLECERLQGFPDGWTALCGASDSARYKALGNSVAIPCVEFLMSGISVAAELSLSYICERLLCCLW